MPHCLDHIRERSSHHHHSFEQGNPPQRPGLAAAEVAAFGLGVWVISAMANRTRHRENNSDSEDYDSGSDSMILGDKSRRPAPPRHRGYDDGRRNGGRSRGYNDGHRSTDQDPEPSISKPYTTDHTNAQCRNYSIITKPLALYPGIDLRYGHARQRNQPLDTHYHPRRGSPYGGSDRIGWR